MDKRTIIGIALIVVITLLMPFYQRWIGGDKKPVITKQVPPDTVSSTPDIEVPAQVKEMVTPEIIQPDSTLKSSQIFTEIVESSEEKTIEIETEYARMIWNNQNGANPIVWDLKKYEHHSGNPVNLIDGNRMKLGFLNVNGREINLNEFGWFSNYVNGKKVYLDEKNPYFSMEFSLPIQDGKITKTVRFLYNQYAFEVIIRFQNLDNYIINRRYFFGWENGLPPTEINIKDDMNYSRAYTYLAEELVNIDASSKYDEEDFNGRVDWTAIRTKYFLASIIPSDPFRTNGANIGGEKIKQADYELKIFNMTIDAQYEPFPVYLDTFTVYLGPLDYYILRKYKVDLQKLVMNKDWYERLFRPISLMIIPAFKFLYRFIPNYGFVIIVFSILIKLVLHPLTKKSYASMSEMQYLQPKMTDLREKYKNDPQRLNREMMKLYKEHGVNPLGGCLPMLLQMPVLFALFIVFRSTIQLRGQPFILWINDLSAPDVLQLGVSLPILGESIHVLPILMGLTMIWQSKMTMTDPKQKMMAYFMPVFLIFIFYSLPSGLNLYYAIFNVLSMAQTRYIKKKTHPNGDNNKQSSTPAASKPPKGRHPASKKK